MIQSQSPAGRATVADVGNSNTDPLHSKTTASESERLPLHRDFAWSPVRPCHFGSISKSQNTFLLRRHLPLGKEAPPPKTQPPSYNAQLRPPRASSNANRDFLVEHTLDET